MKSVRNDTAFIHSRKKREGRKERTGGRINGYERDKKIEEKNTMVQRINKRKGDISKKWWTGEKKE